VPADGGPLTGRRAPLTRGQRAVSTRLLKLDGAARRGAAPPAARGAAAEGADGGGAAGGMALVGYARVSTEEQATARRLDELRAAGCAEVHEAAWCTDQARWRSFPDPVWDQAVRT
jgi:Resolvase, N terminal domain